MAKKIFSIIFTIICVYSISHAADPFYTNLLNEGKALYLAGKYDAALESFKIAEFGLLDEKEYVPELYYFYALTQYKKGAVAESQALLDKMKAVLGEADYAKAKMPAEIERDLSIMTRALSYLGQPGAKPGSLPFFNLFYETWDLLKAGKLAEADARLKALDRMDGDKARLNFLEGMLAFQKKDFKKCLSRLEKLGLVLPAEFGAEASFYMAYSYLKRGDQAAADKYIRLIKDPEHIHQLLDLMEEIKASHQEKRKNDKK